MSEINLDESMDETMSDIMESIEEDEVEEEAPAPSRERDESGRFASKADDPEPEVATEPEPVAEVQESAPVAEAPRTSHLVNPPTTWRANAKAAWDQVPELIREEIHKREVDAMNGVSSLKEAAQFGDQINKTLDPYRAVIRSKGMQETDVVNTMLNAYYTLETSAPMAKAQTLLQTAQQYGCLNEINQLLYGNQGQQPPAQAPQPVDVAAEVERKLAERDAVEQQGRAEAEVANFANAVNEDGTLKYPYFENVKGDMAVILQAADGTGTSMDLSEAYERAIWASPDTRALLQAQQSNERQVEAKDRASKAKRAKGANLSRTVTHDSERPGPTGSVDDTMAEVMKSIKSAAE